MSYNYCYACRVSLQNEKNNISDEIILCNDCKNENYILINKTNSKTKFCLKDEDLVNFPKNTIINKYGRKVTLYYYDDIVSKAHKKYGGISGLIKAQEKRMNRTNTIKNNNKIKMEEKYNMIECRRNLIFSELEKLNIAYTDNINEFYNYIEQGDESGYNFEDIVQIFREYNFLNNKTEYKNILSEMKKNVKNYDNKNNMKNTAVKNALSNYIKNNGNIDEIPLSLL